MSSIVDMLKGALGSGELGKISKHLGTDEGTAKSAVETAMPMLMARCARGDRFSRCKLAPAQSQARWIGIQMVLSTTALVITS